MNEYEKLGLKCGIEIHQQLDTEHKLFCNCACRLSDSDPVSSFSRKLRPVAGETGGIDPAALHEILKNKSFHYSVYPRESCMVEGDEEPPHDLNMEGLDMALTIGLLMDCSIPDEIHMMRKTVIDGSNTSGFQRTAIIGTGGKIKTSFGDVGITNLCLEEEACQILKKEEGRVYYGLDRLGIPLVEIGTSPDIRTPEQAREVAGKLGMIVRSTGKAKRGLGTIRQDINVSIKGGARVEIKGAQNLRMIPDLIRKETERQRSLLEIRKELKKMKFRKVSPEVFHVSHIFRESGSNITRGKSTYAVLIPGFSGFLKRKITPTRTLGNEIANHVRAKSNLKGIIHSDEELESYRLSREFDFLSEHLKARKGDTLIIAVGDGENAGKTMKVVADRINQLIEGVPEETRRALENGDTEYMRPLPGASRLYPETDIPPIVISKKMLDNIRKNLPELIEDRHRKIKKYLTEKMKIGDEVSAQIIKFDKRELFDKLIKSGYGKNIVATTLTSTLRYLERKENVDVKKLKDTHFLETFRALKEGKISKEAIPEILKAFSERPSERIEDVIGKGGGALSGDELRKTVLKTIRENENLLKDPRGEKILLGLVMKKVRGRAEAKKVIELLRKEMGK